MTPFPEDSENEYSSDDEENVKITRISDLNLQSINNDSDNGEDMNNSVNNVKDSNDHKDSDSESNDSRTNPNPIKSRPTKNILEDDDDDTIELPKVKTPFKLPCKECKTHRHLEECSNHPWHRYRIDAKIKFLKQKGWDHLIKKEVEEDEKKKEELQRRIHYNLKIQMSSMINPRTRMKYSAHSARNHLIK